MSYAECSVENGKTQEILLGDHCGEKPWMHKVMPLVMGTFEAPGDRWWEKAIKTMALCLIRGVFSRKW